MGLDFLLQIHDRRRTVLSGGVSRLPSPHAPHFFPTGLLRNDRGAHGGRGPIFAFLGAGLQGGGGCPCGGVRSQAFRDKEGVPVSDNPGPSRCVSSGLHTSTRCHQRGRRVAVAFQLRPCELGLAVGVARSCGVGRAGAGYVGRFYGCCHKPGIPAATIFDGYVG